MEKYFTGDEKVEVFWFNLFQFIVRASLASVFLELLMQKDDYHRALRALLREIARALRYEINLQVKIYVNKI